jgi:hypothetical protein
MSSARHIHDDPRLARISTREQPHLEEDEAAELPLLLHSMGLLRELFGDLAQAVRPSNIVEVGGEGAGLTRELLRHADELDAGLLCVDPAPSATLAELSNASRLQLIRDVSPSALAALPQSELVVLDGDHNYAVVREETTQLLDRADRESYASLIVYHDVCFPCGRRDFYYDPSALETDDLLEHRFDTGVSVFSHDPIVGGGMRSRGSYAIAERAGGERNGVLTAIEDVIEGRDGLVLRILPAVFGLGFLYPADAPWAAEVDALLAPLDRSPLLARLERNRLALYAKVLELQDHGAALGRAYDADRATFESRLAELSGENLRLREQLAAVQDGATTTALGSPS